MSQGSSILRLENIAKAGPQLTLQFSLDGHAFSTSYWYDVDLESLDERFGADAMESIYAHIALFEINKICSLKPDVMDLGDYAKHMSPELAALWQKIFHKVWAQWRYENDLPDYAGPSFEATGSAPSPVALQPGEVEVLAFCGGGKDSLVAMRLLQSAGIPYSSLVYAHSIYGNHARQFELIDALLETNEPVHVHKQWIFDDFLDSPVLDMANPHGVKTLTAAETPSSVFASLPLVLARGYRYIALAHERSANTGNLIWDKTGEDVNHQWGKSYEAEMLMNQYIQEHLVSGFEYFSILEPIHDVVIFELLRDHMDAVPFTHSCNIEKPWCKECPKCAYVWINYMAYLPELEIHKMFGGVNLLDLEENQLSFRQMLGLEEQTPFECIGQIEESRLAFELCKRKGITGKAMDVYKQEIGETDIEAVLDKFGDVHDQHNIPDHFAPRILELLRAASKRRAEAPC